MSLSACMFFAQTLAAARKTLAASAAADPASAASAAADDMIGEARLAMSNPDYMVTAGDVYSLSFVAGSSPVEYRILIDSTYRARVANLALLDAAGKTYATLKRQVEEIVAKNYPLGAAQLVMVSPSVFKVTVAGEVKETAEREAWALSRVSSVIAPSLTPYSSRRRVTITPRGGKAREFDLFKAKRDGDMSQDPFLRPGDTVTVGRMERLVTIKGAVERPGTYDLMEGDNLKALIGYYGGGLTATADTSRMELTRLTAENNKSGEKIYMGQQSIDGDAALECYDSVYVSSYRDMRPVMFVEGAVNVSDDGVALDASTRKAVQFERGMNYAYLVRQNSHWFSATSDIENAYVIRKGEIIPMNISRMLYDASFRSELFVEDDDVLRVPFRQYFVSVAGAVNNPGRYPYIPDRDWEYYIGLAGGFVKTKNVNDKVSIVDAKGKRMKKTDEILPETTITAKTNSFTHYFSIYAPIVTTALSVTLTTISIVVAARN